MNTDRRFQKNREAEKEKKALLAAAAIPVIVIILMVIIVIADRGKQNPDETPVSAQIQETEQDIQEESQTEKIKDTQAAEPETAPVPEMEGLQRDKVPEILTLMKRYFSARQDSDAETMSRIYGRGEQTEAQLEEERKKLRNNAKYVQEFENVATYVMEAEEPGSWLVYTLYDIRFYAVKTAAPMIMWCYVYQDPEGNYLIKNTESLTGEEIEFADKISHSEEVRRLASGVNARLKEALTADQELNEIYGVLRDGSPVYGEEPQQKIVVVESQAEETKKEETSEASETKEEESESQPEEESSSEGEEIIIDAFSPEKTSGQETETSAETQESESTDNGVKSSTAAAPGE